MVLRYRLNIPPARRDQARYTLEVLLEGLGVPAREVRAEDEADLEYGAQPTGRAKIWIRHQESQADWSSGVISRGQVGIFRR